MPKKLFIEVTESIDKALHIEDDAGELRVEIVEGKRTIKEDECEISTDSYRDWIFVN